MKLVELSTHLQTLCHDGYSLAEVNISIYHPSLKKFVIGEIKNIEISDDKANISIDTEE